MRTKRYHRLAISLALLVGAVGAVLAAALAARRRLGPFAVAVDGPSMEPTLAAGDFLMATRVGRIRTGTLVVLEHPFRPGYEMVKRVAALPGALVGGRRLDLDEYWVSGDAPGRSTDSGSFGPVRRSAIRGVVRLRYWPPPRLGRPR